MQNSIISLNFANSKGENQIKARNFEVPGAGGFLLAEYAPGLENFYHFGQEIAIFNSTEELVHKINYYLKNFEERDRIAKAGFKRTRKSHTYEERLQKILASAGLGSRRSCEEFILQGRVSVDGKVITQLGSKADPVKSNILCDGELVRPEKKLYMLINKPVGYVCTNKDELGRPRVLDLLRLPSQRLFTVGRLDADTHGLLIVTNDGDFAQRVAHPRHGVSYSDPTPAR